MQTQLECMSPLQVCRVVCVTGYCSAQQAMTVCCSLALQTIAVPLFATLTTATTTASVRTIQANYQFVGENKDVHMNTRVHAQILFSSIHPWCFFPPGFQLYFHVCVSCLVGEDFWYMGQRCDVRMTRARLVGACFAILLIVVTVIAVTALVAVRRYKAILIQAKVDQTRSRCAPLTAIHTHHLCTHTIHTKNMNAGNIHCCTHMI